MRTFDDNGRRTALGWLAVAVATIALFMASYKLPGLGVAIATVSGVCMVLDLGMNGDPRSDWLPLNTWVIICTIAGALLGDR